MGGRWGGGRGLRWRGLSVKQKQTITFTSIQYLDSSMYTLFNGALGTVLCSK